jgi:urease accessory protein
MKRDGIFAANRSHGHDQACGRRDGRQSVRRRVAGAAPCACASRRRKRPISKPSSSTPPAVSPAATDIGWIFPFKKMHGIVTTAAAEKVYRALGPDAVIGIKLNVSAGRACRGCRETILFDRCRLSRRIDVELESDAMLTMAEMAVFRTFGDGEGRYQFLHRPLARAPRRPTSVRRKGQARWRGGQKLAEPGVAAGGLRLRPFWWCREMTPLIARVRAVSREFLGEVGISAWNGIAVARLCAKDGASLRHDLACVLAALGASLPRIWVN